MQALQHVLDGDLEKACTLLESVPQRALEDELALLRAGMATLSTLSRDLPGNRAERRAAAQDGLPQKKA
jgi:hypothetical protein